MKNLTPKGIALRVSLLVAIIVVLVVSIVDFFQGQFYFLTLFLVFIFSFLFAYFIFKAAIEQFIYKKIKLIYRLIHRLKLNKNEKITDINLNKNIFDNLEIYRREFVGNVAHELKTPIFSIQGYLLTLMEGGLNDPNINEKYLEKANNSVERMITIIEDLDQITKIESGRLQMNFTKFNIIELAQKTIHSLEDKANNNHIEIKIKHELSKPIYVLADYDKIMQVLSNLIVNAIKYNKKEGHIFIKFYDLDKNILIEIADNGIGIDEEHLPRLFERFYRTDKGRAREKGGSGLGLSIVKHIIEAHNQTINVRSSVGVGSTFSFTLQKA